MFVYVLCGKIRFLQGRLGVKGAGERLIKLAREGYGPQTLHSRFALAWGSPVHNTLVLSVLREGRSKDLSPLVGAVTINKYRATLPLSDLTGSGFERSEDDHTASDFLAVLADPQANKICSLFWWYEGREDVNLVILLLINNCPELASLQVEFRNHSVFDFVSSMLEHPSNKLKVLEMPGYPEGDSARFFAALGQSQVSALTLIHSPVQGFYEYLAKDLLVRLEVRGRNQAPSELMMSLAKCTRLAQLKWMWCEFSHPIAFPKSVTKLELDNCTFADGFDWSFLAGSNVRELDLHEAEGVDGNQLGDALAVCLRAKGLDELRLVFCDFVKATLAAVGVEVGRIKSLNVLYADLNDASIRLTALALQSPDSELRELKLEYTNDTTSSIETRLVPASKHPNCNLAKLSLSTYGGAKVAEHFHKRLALFVLLQGRQAKRRYCPLTRSSIFAAVCRSEISFITHHHTFNGTRSDTSQPMSSVASVSARTMSAGSLSRL